MDDALLVRGVERAADVDVDRDGVPGREEAVARELVGERAPDEALHHDVDAPVGHLVEVEHADDVRVLDVHLDVRLAPEARDLAAVARRRAAQDLHRDLVPERHVLGRVHDADAAGADLAPDAVLAAEHGAREVAGRRARARPAARVRARAPRCGCARRPARRTLLARCGPTGTPPRRRARRRGRSASAPESHPPVAAIDAAARHAAPAAPTTSPSRERLVVQRTS